MILLHQSRVRNPTVKVARKIPVAFAVSLFGISRQLFTEKLRICAVFARFGGAGILAAEGSGKAHRLSFDLQEGPKLL
jgi:hypothetical protein